MKKLRFGVLVLVVLTGVSLFSDTKGDNKTLKDKFKVVTLEGGYKGFILKAKNIVFKTKNKKISIPVFKGGEGTLEIDNLDKYCKKNRIDSASSFIIRSKRGYLKKSLMDFLKFYKKSILKDIDIAVPVNMLIESNDWCITYNFELEGIPCCLRLIVHADEKDYDNEWGEYRNVFQINLEETMKRPYFKYKIFPNYHMHKVEVWGQKLGR